MKYCFIMNKNDNAYMAVNGNFVTNSKYAVIFTTKNAEKIIAEKPNLQIVLQRKITSLSEKKTYRLKDIPSEFLIKKPRKPRTSKFVYEEPSEINFVKDNELSDKDNKRVDENYLFRKLNKKCEGCRHDCKQSYAATIISCPDYQKI